MTINVPAWQFFDYLMRGVRVTEDNFQLRYHVNQLLKAFHKKYLIPQCSVLV